MALTGLTWSFDWYNNGLYKILTGKERVARSGGRDRSNSQEKEVSIAAISYEDALRVAQERLPYQGKTIINKPNEKGYRITKYNNKRFNVEASDVIIVNAEDADIDELDLFDDYALGEKISKQI